MAMAKGPFILLGMYMVNSAVTSGHASSMLVKQLSITILIVDRLSGWGTLTMAAAFATAPAVKPLKR